MDEQNEIKDLTEQWKNGELEAGFYYVEEEGKTFISICYKHHLLQVLQDCKVLAPVPSYKEWQEEQKSLKVLAEAYCKEKEENQQLKVLLSKVRDSVQFDYYEAIGGGADYQARFLKDLLTKIDNVMREK